MPPRPRFMVAAAAAALLLLTPVALSAVFGYQPMRLLLDLVSPPLVLYWSPGLDGEEVSASLGANYTSFNATVKATRAPDAFCNGDMSIAVINTATNDTWPLCWIPVVGNTWFEWSSVSLGAGTRGSLHVYNHTRVALYYGQYVYYRAGMLQLFLEPSTGLGDDVNGEHYLDFCFNITVTYSSLLPPSVSAYLNATIYTPGGPSYSTGLQDISAYVDGSWHCARVIFTPSSSTAAAFYIANVTVLLAATGSSIFFPATINSVDVHFDNASLLLNLTAPGVYYTAPLMLAVNTSVLGFNASIVLHRETGVAAEAAWLMDAWSVPVNRPLVYQQGGSLPQESGEVRVNDTYGLAVLVFYQLYSSLPGGGGHWVRYRNQEAVTVRYPVNIDAVDPPPRRGGVGYDLVLHAAASGGRGAGHVAAGLQPPRLTGLRPLRWWDGRWPVVRLLAAGR